MTRGLAALRRLARRAGVPPRQLWPWLLPGAAALLERRWEEMLEHAPVLTGEEHAARVGVGEIEEVIGCSLCGERRMKPLFHPHHPKGRWGYHVVSCVRCGLLYRHPGIRPDRLGELYETGRYARFLRGRYGADRARRYRLVMDAFAPLFADGRGRRLLDFGSGTGRFLEVAHERGFDGYGVDLSPDAVAVARARPSGAKSFHGHPLDVPEIAAGGFGVVTMWSVLAHLATPVEDLAALRSLLDDDGVLLVLTVNGNSALLKARRSAWNGFTPNHLKVYSPSTLPRLLRRAGFGAVVFRPMPGDAIEAGTSGLSAREQRRMRRSVERGNCGNMLRAVAFADPDGPRRWGLEAGAIRLVTSAGGRSHGPPQTTRSPPGAPQ